jgi:hypothetical protein
MSKLSRAVRFVLGIWIIAICLSVPQVSNILKKIVYSIFQFAMDTFCIVLKTKIIKNSEFKFENILAKVKVQFLSLFCCCLKQATTTTPAA